MKPFVILIVQLTCQRFWKYFCIYSLAKTLYDIQHFIPSRSNWGCWLPIDESIYLGVQRFQTKKL